MRPTLRFEVFKRDQFTCRYCGKRSPEAILEVDHVMPHSAGGTDEIENLVTSCYECNRGKGVRLLSNVPAESDVHEKAVEIAEREIQVAELNRWRASQRQREDAEIEQFLVAWRGYFSRDRFVRTSEIRNLLRKLPLQDLLDVLEWVGENVRKWDGRSLDESGWRLFVTVAYRRSNGDYGS